MSNPSGTRSSGTKIVGVVPVVLWFGPQGKVVVEMAGAASAQEPRVASVPVGRPRRPGTFCMRLGSMAIPSCWFSAVGVVSTSSLSHVVSSAWPTTLDARSPHGTHGVAADFVGAVVHAFPVLLSVGTFLQSSIAQFPALFPQSPPWLRSLTSQLARAKANKTRNVVNVGMTTSLGYGAKPRCVSRRSGHGQHTSRGAFGRGATAQTTPTPVPVTFPTAVRSFCSASYLWNLVLFRLPVRAGERV